MLFKCVISRIPSARSRRRFHHNCATDVLTPKDETLSFDQLNDRVLEFADINSWHAVAPMRGPAGNLMRKTLTINIEAR